MTTIKKSGKLQGSEHAVFLCNKKTSLSATGLSAKEIAFVKTQLEKNDKQNAVLNQLDRVVIIQTAESKKQKYLTLENWRKAGANLVLICNELNIRQLTVVDLLNDPEVALAFTEGLALGNYQFLRYKNNAEKELHALQSIEVNSKKVKDRDLEHLQVLEQAVSKTRTLVNEPASFLN